MVLYVNDAEARGLLSLGEAVDTMRTLFEDEARGEVENQPTVELGLRKGFFRLKAGAAYAAGCFGFKAYGNGRYIVFVYSTETGQLDGIVDAYGLTEVRTGAVSALATALMARADAERLAIIGTGREARSQLPAALHARQIRSVTCYSRSPDHRETYASEMTVKHGLPVKACASAEECVRDADIIVTITNANQPVLEGAWIAPGTHIAAIGATTPKRRELDDEAIARAGTVVVEYLPQAQAELGELRYAAERGKLDWASVRELKDVAAGRISGRRSPQEITLFDAVGVGAEDLALAASVLAKAHKQGIGQNLPL